MKVLTGVSLEQPPTYPIISGSIASEHGETDAIMPPKSVVAYINNHVSGVIFVVVKISTKLFI